MTQLFSFEFLVVVLCIVNIVLFILLGLIIRRINRLPLNAPPPDRDFILDTQKEAAEALAGEAFSNTARDINEMLAPLVAEAKRAAESFDGQIREKRKLSRNLNDALDSRIISVNLLLSRAETLHKKLEEQQRKLQMSVSSLPVPGMAMAVQGLPQPSQANVMDQQHQIIELYLKDMDIDTIAQRLAIPKGEVQLVIDLKEKFLAMEQA